MPNATHYLNFWSSLLNLNATLLEYSCCNLGQIANAATKICRLNLRRRVSAPLNARSVPRAPKAPSVGSAQTAAESCLLAHAVPRTSFQITRPPLSVFTTRLVAQKPCSLATPRSKKKTHCAGKVLSSRCWFCSTCIRNSNKAPSPSFPQHGASSDLFWEKIPIRVKNNPAPTELRPHPYGLGYSQFKTQRKR